MKTFLTGILLSVLLVLFIPFANAGFFGAGNYGAGFIGSGGVTWAGNVLTLDNLVYAGRACPTCYATSDGDDANVNSILDESGNDFHIGAGSSSWYPDYSQTALSATQAGYSYDGVDNRTQKINDSGISTIVEATDILTVHWYGSFDLAGSGHVGLFEIGNSGLNTGAQVYVHGTTDNAMVRVFQKDGSYSYIETSFASYDDEIHLYTFEFDLPNDDITIYVDNVDIGGTVTRSDGASTAEELPTGTDSISVGSPHNSFDPLAVLGMLVITADTSTSDERQAILDVASGGSYSAELLPARWVIVGDSQSVNPASGGYDPAWPSILATNNPSITVINEAIAGQTVNTIDGVYASQIGINYKSGAISNNLIICGGTNDHATGRTPAQLQASIDSIVSAATTTGYDSIYVCTVMDRDPDTHDADIATGNATIKAGSGYTDIPLDERAELDDGSDTTYFYDGVHTKEAGHEAIHDEVSNITGLSSAVIPFTRKLAMVA